MVILLRAVSRQRTADLPAFQHLVYHVCTLGGSLHSPRKQAPAHKLWSREQGRHGHLTRSGALNCVPEAAPTKRVAGGEQREGRAREK